MYSAENKILGDVNLRIRNQEFRSHSESSKEEETTKAKKELQVEGSFFLFDEANLFQGGQISPELQSQVDQLTAHGVRVVIFTSENPNGLSTDELIERFTTANGFGSVEGETLGMNDLICTINMNNLEGKKDFDCVAGFALSREIGNAQISSLVDAIIDNGHFIMDKETGKSDYDNGFIVGYQGIDRVLDAAEAAKIAAEQAQQEQQNLPPLDNNHQNTNEIQGSQTQTTERRPSVFETHPAETITAGSIALIAALWGIDFKFFRPKKMIIASANNERKKALEQVTNLDLNTGRGINLFDAVADVYGESYPDDAESTRKEETEFRARIDRLQESKKELLAITIGFFQRRGWTKSEQVTAEIREKARIVRNEAMELLALISEKNDLLDNLNEQKNQSGSNVDKVKLEIDELENWYDEKLDVPAYRSILPPRDKAFVEIQSRYEIAFNNVRINPQFELKGSKQAVELSETLLVFKAAVEAFTSSYETSLALHMEANDALIKWPGRAIDIDQLSNSGSKLLNDAKPGISIPSKFNEVIELSKRAKEEFISAKDFASSTATVLALQDENDQAIKEIEDDGFEDKHITSYREEMTEALTKANQLATLGKWKEAQAQLGILRVKTNEALAEMQRLQELRKQNIIDLKNLAADVEKSKTKYRGDVTEAWEDLQGFKSANYDETHAIWKELRSENSLAGVKVEVVDLKSHFIAIATILEEITDNQSSETDLASQAASKNSFDKQKFDEASTVIREMEKRLAKAEQMMDELIERQLLANKAKKEHSAAIKNAETRLASALGSVDEKEEIRFTDEEVREMIKESGKLIELAEKASIALIFVAALEAANRAADLAIQGKKDADDQINEIRTLFGQVESHKKKSNLSANLVIESIDEEADAVITSGTTKLVTSLKQAMGALLTFEAGLAATENTVLNSGLRDLLEKFDLLDNKTEELSGAYERDKASYSELLSDLKEAIKEAKSAIEDAAEKCDDSDAGSAGDGALSSATSSLPKMAEWGTKRSDVESRIKAANSAKEYAKTAYAQADKAIDAAEAARAREAARLRKIEEDRQEAERQRQRAAERAENERRQSQARETVQQSQSRSRRSV